MTMIIRSLPYDNPISIAAEDIDFMGHVNNACYLRWVQDAVLNHWHKLAPAEAVAANLWVALKHEITYRKPAFLNDSVIATVVLDSLQGSQASYHTLIRRNGEVLAEISSRWCCINARTLRPSRLANYVIECFLPSRAAAPDDPQVDIRN